MLDWLYEALGTMLYWFSSIGGGYYAFALLLYALLFKVVFLPFSIKQQKNQIKLAKLTPKIELIKAKYKGRNDSATMQKQQEEIMALQKSEGYSMMSGCLPMLIQFPIIIFLYNIIRNPISYICHVSEAGIAQIKEMLTALGETLPETIDQIGLASLMEKHNLNAMSFDGAVRELPDFSFFGLDVNLADTPSFTALSLLVAIPFLAAGFQWLTMFLTRKFNGNANQLAASDQQAGCSNKMMDIMMPLMTLWFTFSFSAMIKPSRCSIISCRNYMLVLHYNSTDLSSEASRSSCCQCSHVHEIFIPAGSLVHDYLLSKSS
ncbi:MAG: YidC/Oxa1 family membrane protein insertase [Firmicutes bacterium]|nr:YidC/Oxa1 family membrane protein insertase [Bacillota bacterium]